MIGERRPAFGKDTFVRGIEIAEKLGAFETADPFQRRGQDVKRSEEGESSGGLTKYH